MDNIETGIILESTPLPSPTILLCPNCSTPWSADYEDYCWMRDNDLLFCSCGEALCNVGELKET